MNESTPNPPVRTYSYLGPAGTFTEQALRQVAEAEGQNWRPVHNVGQALDDVANGTSDGAVIAIENSIEGGVSTTQDALATRPNLRIAGEYLVPVNFVLVGKPGTTLDDITVITGHPVAYAQCQDWLMWNLPSADFVPASSNVAGAHQVLQDKTPAQAALAAPAVLEHHDYALLGENIGDNPNAVTRFVLITRNAPPPPATGADKTSLIVELPDDRAGGLLELLEQFSTRGINLSLIESRPIGDELGRYRFVIDANGHIHDERMADALLGVRRFSPNVKFLGSYPRADKATVEYDQRYADAVFADARDWLRDLLSGAPQVASGDSSDA